MVSMGSPSLLRDDSHTRDSSVRVRRNTRLRSLVDAHCDFLARALRNLGVPEAEIDDAVQRTFLVAAKRLDGIQPGAEKAFLYRTALHDAAHVRRTLARRREVAEQRAGDRSDLVATPEQLADQRMARKLLDRLLDEMDPSIRSVFVLYELEEMTMGEIADLLDIPGGTVASRLRKARAEFKKLVRRLQGQPSRRAET